MFKKTWFFKIGLILISLAVLGNIVFLDWKIFRQKAPSEEILPVFSPTPTPTFKTTESSPSGQLVATPALGEETCPQACLLAIDEAKSTLGPTSTSPVTPSASAAVKIFYLPLGSGSTKSLDWADIPGLSSYIDPVNYGKVKSIIFEASLRIPTANGRIYARLYNKNDGRPVWFSEVSAEGSTSILIQSQPITFDAGNKLYQVQAKTTMGFESFIDFTRIKFVTE